MWILTASALAAPPAKPEPPSAWESKWYGRPRGNLRAVSVNGVTSAQAVLGAEGGIRYDHAPILGRGKKLRRGPSDLVGRTRLQGDVLYGITSSSFGYDVRLGSFIGPTSRYVTYQVGPDLWGNGYGTDTSLDYHLPFSLGIDLSNTVIFHIDRSVSAQVGVTPGWAFDRDRQTGGIGPFHELSGFATVTIQAGTFGFVVGYQRVYNAAGVTDGLILSVGL
ncbi:MAG: hypothetical protein R3F61_06020 [Myxococcota bacterium]